MKHIIQLILLFSLFITCFSHAEWTKLHYAAANGNLKQVQIRVYLDDVDAADINGETPLHWAAKNDYKAIVTLLLKKGAKINAADRDGCTPLHEATVEGNEATARLLLAMGAKIDAADNHDRTPLHLAAYYNHVDIARLLLKRGAKIDAADNHDRTPLYWAAWNNHVATVRLLLDRRATIDAATDEGWTPLHRATVEGNEATARLLLDRGANVNAANNRGYTPLHLAEFKNHTRLITLLWCRLLKVRKNQMYALLMATHPHLGAESPAMKLPNELFQHIWQFVKPTIAEIDQEILQQELAQQAVQANNAPRVNNWFQRVISTTAYPFKNCL